MKYSTFVKNNLYGMQYFPNPFPAEIWDEEFVGADFEVFKDAIKRVRRNQSQFPTYSQVHDAIRVILADRKPTYEPEYVELSPEEKTISQEIRTVFWKWYKTLPVDKPATSEELEKYYDGCAKDYLALSKKHSYLARNGEFMDGVTNLFNEADRISKNNYGKCEECR